MNKTHEKRKRHDEMSVEELEQEYDRLLPMIDKGNNKMRIEYIRDLLISKCPDHQFRVGAE